MNELITGLKGRLFVCYVVLLIALAAWGAHNQQLYQRQLELMEEKLVLQEAVVGARAELARVHNPLYIRAWAYQNGMQPAIVKDIRLSQESYPFPENLSRLPQENIAFHSYWRP